MKFEPSKLAHLVIAYHEKFGRHPPEAALRQVNAADLVTMLKDSLATGVPISDADWCNVLPMEFRAGGCNHS